MKKYLILLALPVLLSCQGATKKETIQLKDSLAKAEMQLQERDSIIMDKNAALNNFIKSFNEIHDNINRIKEKQKIISINSQSAEFAGSEKEQILIDIQSISEQMDKNKKELDAMSEKLKNSNLKFDDLDKAIIILTNEMSEKNSAIMDLRTSLEKQQADSKKQKRH